MSSAPRMMATPRNSAAPASETPEIPDDAVIMNDDIAKVPVAIEIARKTERICRENIWISLGVKALVFVLAILGISNMWLAVFADTGVCFVAVINSMRALKHKGI